MITVFHMRLLITIDSLTSHISQYIFDDDQTYTIFRMKAVITFQSYLIWFSYILKLLHQILLIKFLMNPQKNTSDALPKHQTYIVSSSIRSIPPNHQVKQELDENPAKKLKIGPTSKDLLQNDAAILPNNNKQVLLKEYDTRSLRYSNEDYSYLSNQLLARFAQKESAQSIATAFPLFKMLRGIARKFMFNELEIIFFLHTIEDQQWKYEDEIISQFAPSFKVEFLSNQEISNQDSYKQLLLFLICCGYTIKNFFNEPNDQEALLINEHIQQYCQKDFRKFIDSWKMRYMNGSMKIIPRHINKLYKELMKIPKDSSQQIQQDYNALVDQIIQISPPYQNQDSKAKQEKPPQPPVTHPQLQTSTFHMQNPQLSEYVETFDKSIFSNNHQYIGSEDPQQPQSVGLIKQSSFYYQNAK